MTYIPKSSEMLKALQDIVGKELEEIEERKKKAPSIPELKIVLPSKDCRKEPTAEDIFLMEEYRRGVYQGD